MIDKAIEKINSEMQQDASDTYIEIVGHYVIDRCTDDITAAKVAAEGKSLQAAMEQVTGEAMRVVRGNVAVLTPETVFNAVDSYFELQRDEGIREKALMAAYGAMQTTVNPPVANKVALDLADFL